MNCHHDLHNCEAEPLVMRTNRWILGALACVAPLVLSACSSETVAQLPPAPVAWASLRPLPVRAKDVESVTARERGLPDLYVRSLSSASDAGPPFSLLAPLLNPDLASFSSPGMSPAHEPAAIVAAHERLFGAFDDRKLTLSRVFRTPSAQTFEWVMTGVHAREWEGVAATHKPIAFRGVTLLWTKDDGTILDVHVYFDVAVVQAQLGAGPKALQSLAAPTAPTGAPEVLESQGSDDEAKGVALVRASLDALEGTSEATYTAAFTDDVEVATLESAAPARGRAAAKAYYASMHKALGQLDTTVMAAWGTSNLVVVEYTLSGEQLGPIGWVPARRDGVARFEVVDVCELRGGQIARIWRYENPAEILE